MIKPKRPSEFEIQALVYWILKKNLQGYCVRGEYKLRGTGRFDVAILDQDQNIKLIVEVKRTYPRKRTSAVKQIEKYKKIAPVVMIRGYDEAYRCLETVSEILNEIT